MSDIDPAPANGKAPGAPAFSEIMTIDEASAYLQMHRQVVYRHVRAGTLPASRIGRTIRFKKSVLDAYLERNAWATVERYLTFVKLERTMAESHRVEPPRAEPETRGALADETQSKTETDSAPRARFSADVD